MVTALTMKFSFLKPKISLPHYILAFRGILNLSIISSLWWLLGKVGFDSNMVGSLEIPNRARIPLLHNARERVTNVAWLDTVDLCPLAIWGKTELETLNTL